MATSNNKRIEEMATTALKTALLGCPILESFINYNDKTPSWDGFVLVHKNKSQKKGDLLGRASIQIKGTEKEITAETASFSCEIADLRNYYLDGGCIFFLVSIPSLTKTATIYYSSLQVLDLKKILDEAGNRKSKTIHLDKFPQENAEEIASIFISFVENRQKQASFVNKKIQSIEDLQSKGVEIESLSFNTAGPRIALHDIHSVSSFITTHDFYLYAKPKNLDIEIPVDKVSNAILSRPIYGKVLVKDVEYYPSYSVLYKNGQPVLIVGKGLSISFDTKNDTVSLSFKPTGTLDDYIKAVECFIAVIENKEITLNGATLPLNGLDDEGLASYKEGLQRYKDIKKTLDILGVSEELKCDSLSKEDDINIRNLVNAVLFNKRICFPGAKEYLQCGPCKISNLYIWLWATRQPDGSYRVENFFDHHLITVHENDDPTNSNFVHAPNILLLNKDAFVHTSNMDYDYVWQRVCEMEYNPLLINAVNYLLLNILLGYDAKEQKDSSLIELAEKICDWLSGYGDKINYPILRLNQLQIIKRRRTLNTHEIIELGKLTDSENPDNIQCAAFLLLGDVGEAQKSFDRLPSKEQEEFIHYPICHFGQLIPRGEDG